MQFTYMPRGVCSRQFNFDVEDGVIRSVEIIGGCHGNTQGICALVKGQKAEDIIGRVKGISCNGRPTSCPDQLSIALTQAMAK